MNTSSESAKKNNEEAFKLVVDVERFACFVQHAFIMNCFLPIQVYIYQTLEAALV